MIKIKILRYLLRNFKKRYYPGYGEVGSALDTILGVLDSFVEEKWRIEAASK